MSSRKYRKDYTLTPEVDLKGRLRPVASYIGDYFRFTAPDADVRAAKIRYAVLGVLAAAALFVLLFFSDIFDWNHRYLSLPMALNVIPAFGVGMGIGRFCTAQELMTRKLRDRICDRLPAFSMFFMVFSFLSVACAAAYLILAGFTAVRLLYALDAALMFALSILIFAQRKILAVETVKP